MQYQNFRCTQVSIYSIKILAIVLVGAYQSKVINEPNTKNSDKTLTDVLTKHTGLFIVD